MLEFIEHSSSDVSLEFSSVQEKISSWKKKFRCRRRCYENENENEKNVGYLVISNPELDPVFISDHQATRNAQPCVQINNTSFDPEQIQYSSMKSFEASVSPPEDSSLAPYFLPYNHR